MKVFGKFIHPEFVYEGDFKNNLFDGKGKIIYTSENITYEGAFKQGNFNGKGILNVENKFQYVGNLKDGLY